MVFEVELLKIKDSHGHGHGHSHDDNPHMPGHDEFPEFSHDTHRDLEDEADELLGLHDEDL